MLKPPNITLVVDYASRARIFGWAIDRNTGGFPQLSILHKRNHTEVPVQAIERMDVNSAENLPADAKVGFRVSLGDALNDLPDDYALMLDGEVIWDFDEFVSEVETTSNLQTAPFRRQTGSREVIVVYAAGSWLHKAIAQIHNWRPNYLLKEYSSGVSFSFIDAADFGKISHSAHKENTLFLIEDKVYRNYKVSKSMLETRGHAVLSENLVADDYTGVFSVARMLMGSDDDKKTIDALWLLKFLMSFIYYSDMFFDSQNMLYTYHSGKPDPWMQEYVRKAIDSGSSPDVLILSKNEEKFTHIRQIDDQNCVTFVRLHALRYLLDVMNRRTEDLIAVAFKRGARVGIVNKETK